MLELGTDGRLISLQPGGAHRRPGPDVVLARSPPPRAETRRPGTVPGPRSLSSPPWTDDLQKVAAAAGRRF
ncbi:hypothetical protein QJS66_09915 [Kocuria rhizophila]|nr:hypothetical protein QJS66_09915 [Kocuria rhizophila]